MLNLPSLVQRPAKAVVSAEVGAVVGAFESETQAVLYRTRPKRQNTIFYVLIGMLVLLLVFATFFKVDVVVEGAPAMTMAVDGSIYVQPYQKGVVHQILVKVGDIVKKDQVLAILDPTFTAADVAKYQQTVDATQEDVNRLEAEQKGVAYKPAGTTDYQRLQLSQYLQRQAQFNSNVANFDAQIAVQQAAFKQYQQDVDSYSQRLKANVALEDMQRKLDTAGWGSQQKTLEANDARLEIQRLLTFSAAQIPQIESQIAALQAQRSAFITQWQSDIAQWLSNDRTTIAQAQQSLAQANMSNDLVTLKAPTDAYVLKLGQASVGSIVGGGTPDEGSLPMFTLVPLLHPLQIEAQINPQDTGFIKVGDPVNIKFDAYDYSIYGTAKGVLKSVSENSFTVDWNNQPVQQPYYLATVEITDTHLQGVSNPRLIPGMTLEADVVANKRSILSYLIEGAFHTVSEAMREP